MAAAAGVDESTVARWRRDPRFWGVLQSVGIGAAIGGLSDALLFNALRDAVEGKLSRDSAQWWVELAAKRAGNLRTDAGNVAVSVTVGGAEDLHARTRARVQELGELFAGQSPQKAGGSGDLSATERGAHSTAPAGGVAGGGA